MKIVYIGIFKNDAKPAVELASAKDVDSYSYFTRKTAGEFATVFSSTFAERAKPDSMMDVSEGGHVFHVYSHADPVCGVIVTDEEYPSLAAHSILRKIVEEFRSKYPLTAYTASTPASPKLSFPELDDYIKKYQNPENADSTMKIQKELDETKIVLHNTIQSVLERGEKIDNLVQKSEGLSAQSKMFYTQAKKQNSCCNVM